MSASTKAQRQAKQSSKPAKTVKAPAKPKQKPAPAPVEVVETKNQQGRRIQQCMTASLQTVEQIAAKTGLTVGRVQEHVNWEISKGRTKLNGKKQVQVISQPRYRGE